MRLFVAVNFSPAYREALYRYIELLSPALKQGSPTKPQNLHLTLAFIGEVDSARAVSDALSRVRFSGFELFASRLAYFSRREGRLYYLELEPKNTLSELSDKVKAELASEHIAFDSARFTPHVTLFRRAQLNEGALLPPPTEISSIKESVSSIQLMRSDRKDNQLVYTPIYTVSAEAEQ